MESLFIQIMYKSQFQKIDPYDWFCGPWSHIMTVVSPWQFLLHALQKTSKYILVQ